MFPNPAVGLTLITLTTLPPLFSHAGTVGKAQLQEFNLLECGRKLCVQARGPQAAITPTLNYYAASDVSLTLKGEKKAPETYLCRSFTYEAGSKFILCDVNNGKIKALAIDLLASRVSKL